MKSILTLVLFVLSLSAEAKLLQIIHTNDLHSFFPVHENNTGGYARIYGPLLLSRRDGVCEKKLPYQV